MLNGRFALLLRQRLNSDILRGFRLCVGHTVALTHDGIDLGKGNAAEQRN